MDLLIQNVGIHNRPTVDGRDDAMDARFEDVFSDYRLSERLQILGYGTRDAYLDARPTVEAKARDMVRHFARQFARRMNRAIDTIPSETMNVLVAYHWPGNIRELQNLVERAVILSTGPVLNVPLNDLRSQPQAAVPANAPGNGKPRRIETLEEVERRHVLETLDATDWVVGGPKGAAVLLGLKRSTLQVRMEKLGIRRARAAE